ncbi:MAG TPA: ATP-binding cassette domain-containing protein [Ktedonobacteraceae bacterium]|nr:ATP-binding cassette domain-containing protein [Ktedonobacteraceae bacterium]
MGTEQQETMLRVEYLNKAYALPNGRLQVLRDIQFRVRRGEFLAITGPSGSGKTTLLSLLGALDRPESGEIWLDSIADQQQRISGGNRWDLCSSSFTCCLP